MTSCYRFGVHKPNGQNLHLNTLCFDNATSASSLYTYCVHNVYKLRCLKNDWRKKGMKKGLSLFLSICMIFALATFNAPLQTQATTSLTMLRTDGNKIVNAQNQQITLRGTNLGGWLMQQPVTDG